MSSRSGHRIAAAALLGSLCAALRAVQAGISPLTNRPPRRAAARLVAARAAAAGDDSERNGGKDGSRGAGADAFVQVGFLLLDTPSLAPVARGASGQSPVLTLEDRGKPRTGSRVGPLCRRAVAS